jgi:hypothetical protein
VELKIFRSAPRNSFSKAANDNFTFCRVCRVEISGKDNFAQHLAGRQHRMKAAADKVPMLESFLFGLASSPRMCLQSFRCQFLNTFICSKHIIIAISSET